MSSLRSFAISTFSTRAWRHGTDTTFPNSFLTTPIERLKILQQSSPSLVQPSLISLVRSHSIPSLYRGLTPTILRDLAYGPYFATYEYVCRWGIDEPVHEYERDLRKEEEREVREVGTTRVLVAGGAAGIVGWGSTYVYCASGGVHDTGADQRPSLRARCLSQVRAGRRQDSYAGQRAILPCRRKSETYRPPVSNHVLDHRQLLRTRRMASLLSWTRTNAVTVNTCQHGASRDPFSIFSSYCACDSVKS